MIEDHDLERIKREVRLEIGRAVRLEADNCRRVAHAELSFGSDARRLRSEIWTAIADSLADLADRLLGDMAGERLGVVTDSTRPFSPLAEAENRGIQKGRLAERDAIQAWIEARKLDDPS